MNDKIVESGVYKIVNITNGKLYVGSAVDFNDRWYRHRWELNKNDHHSSYLQRAWNKDGESSFRFEIIEECEKEILIEREQHYIDVLKPEYNMCLKAGNTLGYKYTEEQKQKLSEAQKGLQAGEKNPAAKLTSSIVDEIRKKYVKGKVTFEQLALEYNISEHAIALVIHNKKWIDENYSYTVDKIAHSNKAKLSWEIVEEIRKRYVEEKITQKEIAQEFSVNLSTIKRIVQNRTWVDPNYHYNSSIGIKRRGFATKPR